MPRKGKKMAQKKTLTKKAPAKKAAPKVAARKPEKPKKLEVVTRKDLADMLLYMETMCVFLRLVIKNLDPKLTIPLNRSETEVVSRISLLPRYTQRTCET